METASLVLKSVKQLVKLSETELAGALRMVSPEIGHSDVVRMVSQKVALKDQRVKADLKDLRDQKVALRDQNGLQVKVSLKRNNLGVPWIRH